jgi:CheY-like chemotaxis protein
VAAPQRPFSILLVDDNVRHRILLLRALRDQGHSVLHAADGASGEALCRASRLKIDALVACADLKRMSGFELARRMVRLRPEVRVLLMCRHLAGPEEAHRACERGYAVIEEPFTPEELCRRLTGLLGPPRNDTWFQEESFTLEERCRRLTGSRLPAQRRLRRAPRQR